MKKLVAALFAMTLLFSSVGTFLPFDDSMTAEAKGYKSGKKGFNKSNNNTNTNIQKKDQNTTTKNQSPAAKNTANKSGGLMKGLMMGGLAGLLFGSLFGGMGFLGSILGLLVNVGAILLVVFLAAKIWSMVTKKKRDEEEAKQWR